MKPGSCSPSRIRGKRLRSCQESPEERISTSRASAGIEARPADRRRGPRPWRGGDRGHQGMLFTSFATRPSPTGPQCDAAWRGRPSRRARGRPGLQGPAASPPAHDGQGAGGRPRRPAAHRAVEVGDARGSRTASASSRATAGAMVLISTRTGGGVAGLAACPPTTARPRPGESVTQEHARSAPSTASAIEPATTAGRPSRPGGCAREDAHLVAGRGQVADHSRSP